MALDGFPGFSYSAWQPDEPILASSLNLRERSYGVLPLVDYIGYTDSAPVLTIALIPPAVYGTATYGTGVYG